MLLFHRPFTNGEGNAPFALSVVGMDPQEAKAIIFSRYKDYESVDCSDFEKSAAFNRALETLHEAARWEICELLAYEFTEAFDCPHQSGEEDLMFLESRALDTGLAQVAGDLLEHHYDELELVIGVVRNRARLVG